MGWRDVFQRKPCTLERKDDTAVYVSRRDLIKDRKKDKKRGMK